MSMGTPFDDRERVRQATDLVDLVGSLIPLERRGRLFVGLCPWHDDSRPSLQVNPERQQWKCWVCNIGGDCFDFVMQRESVDFPQSLQMLADRAGITLQRRGRRRQEDHDQKTVLFEVLRWAQEQFHGWLKDAAEAEPAREYLRSRGIQRESVERFAIGACPPQWQWLIDRAKATSFREQVLESAGLVLAGQRGGYYDRFRGRLMFPIRDEQGRTVAFGGRVLPSWSKPEEPKYVNSPESRVFSKHRQLYALDVARDAIRKSSMAVVVEGYTDAVMAHQSGLTNVVAVLGTALGEGHIRILKRYTDTVCLLLDGDQAGVRRANEVLDLFVTQQLNLRVATLPNEQDPADVLREQGAAALRSAIEAAPDAFEYKLRAVTAGIDLQRDTHRAHQALEQLLATLAKTPVGGAGRFSQQLRLQQMLGRVAAMFGVEEQMLRRRLAELRHSRVPSPPRTSPAENTTPPWPELNMRDREFLELLIGGGEVAQRLLRAVGPADLEHPAAQQIRQIAQDTLADGRPLALESIMLRIEEPRLKYLLVDVADSADAKLAAASASPEQRCDELIAFLDRKRADRERQEKLAALKHRRMDEEEEVQALLELIEQQRVRQGISAPTDG